MNKKVDFDEYADNYEKLLQDQLAFFSNDRDYFSAYKVNILQNICKKHDINPSAILEFGSGIGLNLPFLQQNFPNSDVYASDISEKSMDYIKQNYEGIICVQDKELEQNKYDLIFVAGVFHHIAPELRRDVVKRLLNLLNKNGVICVFEHNPYNPVTRHMVNTCPFDEDAVLLTKRGLKETLLQHGNAKIVDSGYCLFFPEKLKKVAFLESFLTKIPLGGQHYICVTST